MKKITNTILAIALSIGVFAQQRDTMFVHTKTGIVEFATADVDSIIFYRIAVKPTDYTKLRINEVSGVGHDSVKFYELFNIGTEPINLAGVTLHYNANGGAGQAFPPNDDRLTWTGCATQVIKPGEIFLLKGRNNPCSFTTGLTAARILIITLSDPNGNVIDRCIRARDMDDYDFTDKSFSRVPNGTGQFYFTTPTPNASNGTSTAGLVLVPETPNQTTDPDFFNHPVFDLSALASITLEVTEAQWNQFLAEIDINLSNEEKYPANMTYTKNGETVSLNNIAFRIRGNTSRRRPELPEGGAHSPTNPIWQNAHFSLDFREFNRDNRLHGLRRIMLKWHKDDPMFCREIYGYDLQQRMGVWTAPRVAYTKLYIKVGNAPQPAYFGMYMIVEHPEETYVQNRHSAGFFSTSTGDLWKCTYTGGSNGGKADLTMDGALNKMGVEDIKLDESLSLRYTYDLKTNKGNINTSKTNFNNWITNLNTLTGAAFKTWISANFDVDLFLKTMAVDVAVGHWDNYWGNANNYYLYFESTTNRGYFVPYDYDNTLGTTWDAFNAATQDALRWGNAQTAPLIAKLLEIDEYREKYMGYLNELIDPAKDLFDVDRSIARIQGWHQMIGGHLQSDCIWKEEATHSFEDRGASWGNMGYTILARNGMNFFELKANSIRSSTAIPTPVNPVSWQVGLCLETME